MDAYAHPFDARKPWVYVILSVLVMSLFALRLPHKDTLFIMLNVIIYTIITSSIFYGYTKYEERKITEGYMKNLLEILYEKDRDAYDNMLEQLRKRKKPDKMRINFIERYSTLLLACLFTFMSVVYYTVFRSKISLTSIGRNVYYLSILGFTEIFIAFFVMTRIPQRDIINLMDTFVREKESCSQKNAVYLSGHSGRLVIEPKCNTFSDDGDTCNTYDPIRGVEHHFTCDEGKIYRSRNEKRIT